MNHWYRFVQKQFSEKNCGHYFISGSNVTYSIKTTKGGNLCIPNLQYVAIQNIVRSCPIVGNNRNVVEVFNLFYLWE